MSFRDTQNPGIGGLEEISDSEIALVQNLEGLSYSAGDIIYHTGTEFVRLAAGSEGYVLKILSGIPTWGASSGGVSGSGTTNELAYWSDSSTLAALAVATYPSLTEVSYVKGVTSAIQTQIDGKAARTLGNLASVAINTSLLPASNDGAALGSGSLAFSDLFLASGAVINFNNGTYTITHSTGNLLYSISNTSTTPMVTLNQSSTGDAAIRFALGSTRSYVIGIDNSATDVLSISSSANGSAVLGTGTLITLTSGGLLTVSGGITSSAGVTTLGTLAGAIDAGGATSFEIPNGSGGTTVDAAGEVTIDTTSRTLNFYDGTTEAVIQPIISKSITIESPTSSEDVSMFYVDDAVTITKIVAVLVGSSTPSVTWTVRHGTDRSGTGAEAVTGGTTTTSTTTGSVVTSFNDATIVADSFVWLETTAQSGTVNSINITVFYRQDA